MADTPLFLQVNYAKRCGSFLERFEQKGPDTFNFRCPICGDSHKSESKKRGWFFQKSGSLFAYCHNCGYSALFDTFLKKINPNMYRELMVDKFQWEGGGTSVKKEEDLSYMKTKPILKTEWRQFITWNHPDHVKKYLEGRKLPLDRFGYTKSARDLAIDLYQFYGLEYDKNIPDIEGVVIPFITEDDKCNFIQIRTFSNDKRFRYLTIGFDDSDIKLFGLDKLDYTRPIYVTEGPFDSCFIINGVATADSALGRASLKLPRDNLVLVYDNEPRAPVIVNKLKDSIDKGFKVVMFPEYIEEKDINDMVLAGRDVQTLVEQYTFHGLTAKMQFATWKKI